MGLTPHQLKKVKQGVCTEFRCTNKARKGRKMCYKCKSRRQKKSDPIKYLFNIKKQRAKERGINWDWPYNEFKAFIERTGYLAKKGRYAATKTIDRVKSHIGYQSDNVQILTHSENARKGNRDTDDFEREIEDLPF